jgi:prepilin signal peptidase PulO-like enzyme (type II secretory pathway)
MPEFTTMQTLLIGGAIVGFNATVSAVMVSFANWWTQRALRKMEKINKGKALPECQCLKCPQFEKCLGRGTH